MNISCNFWAKNDKSICFCGMPCMNYCVAIYIIFIHFLVPEYYSSVTMLNQMPQKREILYSR